MYVYAEDPISAVIVIVHIGTSTDDDQGRYVEAVAGFTERYRQRNNPVFVLVADPGSEPPNARWRQRIADTTRRSHPGALVVFVTESPLHRGIITAINWLRPPPFRFTAVSDIRGAIDWIEKHRRGVGIAVQQMYAEARLGADRESLRVVARTGRGHG